MEYVEVEEEESEKKGEKKDQKKPLRESNWFRNASMLFSVWECLC
jgi:hypothetical protein